MRLLGLECELAQSGRRHLPSGRSPRSSQDGSRVALDVPARMSIGIKS